MNRLGFVGYRNPTYSAFMVRYRYGLDSFSLFVYQITANPSNYRSRFKYQISPITAAEAEGVGLDLTLGSGARARSPP